MADFNTPHHSPNDDDDLLERLLSNLQDVETQEILKGMTREELEEKGFVGDKDIFIERASFRETTEKEKLVFEPGIEYERLADHEDIDSIDFDKLIFLPDVARGQLVATRELNENVPVHAGRNVEKGELNNRECFRATAKGKVLIIGDTLHVYASDIDCTIAVRLSPDKMIAFMTCAPGYGEGRQLSYETVIAEMRTAGILFGIQECAIHEAVTNANERRVVQKDIVVAQGTAPQKGPDASVEYRFALEDETHTFKILSDGRIDYKGNANIPIARKGQVLATISLPEKGTPGMNVVGEAVPAENGKDTYLVAGTGVKGSEDGRKFFAGVSGCIILNPPVLEVLDLYEVKGDVDYSTGSIDFNGSVVIGGTVREGFEVKASGDIIVRKCIEAARLTAGRDIRVMGGIQGQGKGLVSAGRDMYAEFAQNARIEAQGNVYINDFAVNSYIFCKYFKAQKGHGSIVGGEIYVQRGMDVMTLGSPGGTKTYVTAGSDYLVKRKIGELEKVMEFCAESIQKIDIVLKPVLRRMKENPSQMQSKAAVVEKTVAKRHELAQQLTIMKAKREHLRAQLDIEAQCIVKVSKICHSDVYLSIKGLKKHITRKRENIRFFEDSQEGTIRTGPY